MGWVKAMFHWLHRLVGAVLVLTIGAGPVCACPWMWNQPATTSLPAHQEMACCQSEKEAPPASPDSTCEHCPLMNPTHATVDQSAAVVHAPTHWIAWVAPAAWVGVMSAPAADTFASAQSPPTIPKALLHLHCQLTT